MEEAHFLALAVSVQKIFSTLDSMTNSFEKIEGLFGYRLVATHLIPAGTILFGWDDWEDEDEKNSFTVVSPQDLALMSQEQRATFIRFAYNVDPVHICGTFYPEKVRHSCNFINHSCEPNVGYDRDDHIVAIYNILPGEDLTMDYGTYSFSFDHDFICQCGSSSCRGRVTQDDWKRLIYKYGYHFPTFMHTEIQKMLEIGEVRRKHRT